METIFFLYCKAFSLKILVWESDVGDLEREVTKIDAGDKYPNDYRLGQKERNTNGEVGVEEPVGGGLRI